MPAAVDDSYTAPELCTRSALGDKMIGGDGLVGLWGRGVLDLLALLHMSPQISWLAHDIENILTDLHRNDRASDQEPRTSRLRAKEIG